MNPEAAQPASGPSGPAAAAMDAPPPIDPERWLEDHGDSLFHYALSRLRNPARAEDLVQETLLAALRSSARYQGRSSERTWLVGILRHKLLDHLRKAGRETSFSDLEFYGDEEREAFANEAFPDHWVAEQGPGEWTQPGASLDRAVFWQAFEACVSKLPERVARVFLMRELDSLGSDDICSTLNISPNNLWVMLHRARMALRRCLEGSWFGRPGE